jgi:hypothetical protein
MDFQSMVYWNENISKAARRNTMITIANLSQEGDTEVVIQ